MKDDFFNSDLSKEEAEELDKICKEEAEAENREFRQNAVVLEKVKSMVSSEMFEDIKASLEDSENTFSFIITNKPKGEHQQEAEYPAIGGIWVDQTTNGGYSGDDYAGTVSIKLKKNKYFEYSYWM